MNRPSADAQKRESYLSAWGAWRPSFGVLPMRPAPRRLALLLALTLFILYALTSAGTLSSRDGGIMYDTAEAITGCGTLVLPSHHHGVPGVHGQFFSKYGLGQSLVEIPFSAVGQAVGSAAATYGRHVTVGTFNAVRDACAAGGLRLPPLWNAVALAIAMLTNAAITALSVLFIYYLFYSLGGDARDAALAAALVGLASPLWPYAKTDFSEPLSTLGLLGAIVPLIQARSRPTATLFAWAGLWAAVALLAKLTAVVALPAIALYALFVAVTAQESFRIGTTLRRLIVWLVPLVAGASLIAMYNVTRFGRITSSGYQREDLPFRAPLVTGLHGLLLSTGKGLLWYCPLVLLAVLLWPVFVRRRRAEALLVVGIAVPTLILFATYPVWWGGYCWGPRYLVPIVPLLLLPLAFLFERTRRSPLLRRLAVVIGVVSVLVQILGVSVLSNRYLLTLPAPALARGDYLWSPPSSPLLAHGWLVGYDVVTAIDGAQGARLLARYPWHHADGVSAHQRATIVGSNYWWWAILERYGLRIGAAQMIGGGGAAILLLLLWLLRGSLRAEAARAQYTHWQMALRDGGA